MSELADIGDHTQLRVATYNFCQGGADYDATHRVLQALQPDILFAQELLDPAEYQRRGRVTWQELGYSVSHWRSVRAEGRKQWGSAVFTRQPAREAVAVPEQLAGWVVGAVLEPPAFVQEGGRPLKAFSVHTPTKVEANYYIWQAQEILEFLAEQVQDADLLVGGDFNVTISVRGEIEQPQQTPMELEIIEYMRRAVGLVNCWQVTNPNTLLPRTFHGRDTSNAHIDGLFVSPRWWRYLKSCMIGSRERGWTEGDHYPVVAEFSEDFPRFGPRVLRPRTPATVQA
jgi:endonuclease/exonuclease/phosphatase family metal-dependent hydrolase